MAAGATMPPPTSHRATLRSNSPHFPRCGTRCSARVAIGRIATRCPNAYDIVFPPSCRLRRLTCHTVADAMVGVRAVPVCEA